MPAMKLEITPEPTPDERAAIERALAESASSYGRADGRSTWWREGLEDALERDPSPSYGGPDRSYSASSNS